MPSVLLVDDEFDVRDLLSAGLLRDGYEVCSAENGSVAMSQLQQRQFDILITDLQMPVMDGNLLLESIAGTHREMIRIVVTGFSDSENVTRALNAGADHLIEKPVDISKLKILIKKLLAERALHRSQPDVNDLDDLTSRLYELRLRSLDLNEKQRFLLGYILKGVSNRGISQLTGQSEQVVKNSVSILYKKLGINSRSQLFHVVFPV